MSSKIKKREIYYAKLPDRFGSEQGGTRPILIVQNDRGNKHSPTTLIAPITSAKKKPLPTHVKLGVKTGLQRNSVVLLEQIRVIDKTRLPDFVADVSEDKIREIDTAIAVSFGIAKFAVS